MKIIELILNSEKITKDTSFVLGVSGGMDSMVLLHYFHNNGYSPVIVHFNHNTRMSNLQDKDLIVNYATTNNIKYFVRDINITQGNFHNEARKMRYTLLKEIAGANNIDIIMTGHHLDDLAETVLIKLTRGSNLYGYAGMHPSYKEDGFTFIRPLLFTSKEDVAKYQVEKHVLYFEDESNYEDTYLRNRYRHAVIPILKQENNRFLERIYNYHHQLSGAAKFIRDYSLKFINNDNVVIIDMLLKEDNFIQEGVLAILLEQYDIVFSFETLKKLVEIINSDQASSTYNLSNNMIFIKSYNEAFLKFNDDNPVPKITLKLGENKLSNVALLTLLDTAVNNDEETIEICYNKLTFPLKVRGRIDGDRLAFDYGHKKLKDLLIDLKVPQYKRDHLLVLTDSDDTIIWVQDVYTNNTLGNENCIYVKVDGTNV